jgi:hypothetical protein
VKVKIPDTHTWSYGALSWKVDAFDVDVVVPGTVTDVQHAIDYSKTDPDFITKLQDWAPWTVGIIPWWLQLYEQARMAMWDWLYGLKAIVNIIVTTENVATNKCGETMLIENDHYFRVTRDQSMQFSITLDDLFPDPGEPSGPQPIPESPSLPPNIPVDEGPDVIIIGPGDPLPSGDVDNGDLPIPGYFTREGGWFYYLPETYEGVGLLDTYFRNTGCWPYWLGPSYSAKREVLDANPIKYQVVVTEFESMEQNLRTDQCQCGYCGFRYRRIHLSWYEWHPGQG